MIILLLAIFIIANWNNPTAHNIVVEHFVACVALPLAGVFALLVVALFRSTEGRIQFAFLGFKFEGASGPIIMWVICLLVLVGSMRMLWGLH
jgi:hypothetical protein